ncbi:hypothetical protein QC762_0059480 [Podospora pseudocomata]|uniref:Zincin n=1 Tax=Podospora pseudocomata TaxID=2093779 RepID=A0ABR0GKR4_9PEZI|nr:hypothetical protein QC762_0059480 [Podospora pseudocomata]
MGQFQSAEVCTTPACIQAASHILENLAPNWKDMDPCTDFDKMVCHGFNQLHDSPTVGLFAQEKTNNRLLREILERPYEEATAVQPYVLRRRDNAAEHNFDMAHRAYAACMDSDAIEAAGVKPLMDLVNRINEQWPIEMDYADDLFDEADDTAGLHKVIAALTKLNVRTWNGAPDGARGNRKPDPIDQKKQRIIISIPDFSLNYFDSEGRAYLDSNKTSELKDQIAGAFRVVFPVSLNEETAKQLAGEIVEMEISMLREASKTAQDGGNSSTSANIFARGEGSGTTDPQEALKKTIIPLAELRSFAPVLGLDVLVRELVAGGSTPDAVVVLLPAIWSTFEQAVKKQRKIVVQSWLLWKVIKQFSANVESNELKNLDLGGDAGSNKYDTCVEHVDDSLRWILDQLFVRASYPELTRSAAAKMATNIREEMKVHVEKLSWMSEETRKRTVKKLDNMKLNIGFPEHDPDLRSSDDIAEFYSGVNITSSFFDNALEALRYQLVSDARMLSKPTSQSEWTSAYSHQTNAAYESTVNSIFMPAGVSRPPFFHPDLPEWALYGALGTVIGHEITHGLDSSGRQYDENALKTNWWDDKSVAEYAKRQQCFEDQYTKFELVGPDGKKYPGNGNRTVGENISDAGGLAVAYDAWIKERKSMPNTWDQGLPGLGDFTHEQLFFILYGNVWCDALTAQERVEKLRGNPIHAPNLHRILGGTANSRAFKEAFKCPKKEPECEIF